MPKGILEFDLVEEETEYYLALNGHRYSSVIDTLDQEMRKVIKYEAKESFEEWCQVNQVDSLAPTFNDVTEYWRNVLNKIVSGKDLI